MKNKRYFTNYRYIFVPRFHIILYFGNIVIFQCKISAIFSKYFCAILAIYRIRSMTKSNVSNQRTKQNFFIEIKYSSWKDTKIATSTKRKQRDLDGKIEFYGKISPFANFDSPCISNIFRNRIAVYNTIRT